MARPERLQKYIARCGAASRRAAEELILSGRVRVNKQVVTELGTKVDSDNDKVFLDGTRLLPEKKLYYIMLNKPKGYIATAKDERGRSTVTELVADIDARLYPVGRLDYLSEGLLFLTNDGDFAYRLTHPAQHVAKKYQVVVSGIPEFEDIKKLRAGVDIGGYVTAPARVDLAKTEERTAQLNITLTEGKNRQIRKMCEAVGFPVLRLKRVSAGGVALGNLPLGKWRHLTEAERKLLCGGDKNDNNKNGRRQNRHS